PPCKSDLQSNSHTPTPFILCRISLSSFRNGGSGSIKILKRGLRSTKPRHQEHQHNQGQNSRKETGTPRTCKIKSSRSNGSGCFSSRPPCNYFSQFRVSSSWNSCADVCFTSPATN